MKGVVRNAGPQARNTTSPWTLFVTCGGMCPSAEVMKTRSLVRLPGNGSNSMATIQPLSNFDSFRLAPCNQGKPWGQEAVLSSFVRRQPDANNGQAFDFEIRKGWRRIYPGGGTVAKEMDTEGIYWQFCNTQQTHFCRDRGQTGGAGRAVTPPRVHVPHPVCMQYVCSTRTPEPSGDEAI